MRCAGLSPRNGRGEDRNRGGADMAQVRTWVGLDVHAAKVVAAIADSQSGELAGGGVGGGAGEGPAGGGGAGAVAGRGTGAPAAAPGKTGPPPPDGVKPARRDAERLARLLMIG